ncbi:glycerol kinase, partial [Malassezia cuniculi]
LSVDHIPRSDILRRIEEDRERHKQLREESWKLPPMTYMADLVSENPVPAGIRSEAGKDTYCTPDAVTLEFEQTWETTSDLNDDDVEVIREETALWWGADRDVRLYSYATAPGGDATFTLADVIPTGHKRTVRHVSWAPSGDMFATASFDTTVGIWERIPEGDGPVWDCAGTLEGHDSECKSVEFSHNGSLLGTCSRDKSVWVWEVQQEAEFEVLSVMMEHSQDVKCVAWHPKEEILASASYDDTIKLYIDDPSEDWFCYTTLTGHTSTVWSLAFSPCGNYLASGSDDTTIRIWRRHSAQECAEKGIEPDGKVPGRGGDKWIECHRITGHFSRSIYSISWAPDEDMGKIAAAGADGKIVVFALHNGDDISSEVIAKIDRAHGISDINCVAWSPDAQMLASAGDDGNVHIWAI